METYGRYQLLAKLATGGMAQVFLARPAGVEGDETLVVVKRILPHLAESEEFVRMFLQEARVAARLNHPHIAQIYDVGKVADTFYIAMEYIHGEDFRRIVRQAAAEGRTLPIPLACRMIIGACEGLEFAHDKSDEQGKPLGIVHRDVSPQNLLVTFEGGVKVIDFGIAKAADSATHTRTGVLKGKYSYMSPEQADGKKVDRRSDVFALGIVLYELVTQQRLFKRASDLGTIQAVTACRVPRPSEVNPSIDSELEGILLRVLTKERDRRTQTAGQLAKELEEYLGKHRLAGTSAHLKQFMREIYSERLARETKLGRPFYEEELQGGQPRPTPSSSSFDFDRLERKPPPPPVVVDVESGDFEEDPTTSQRKRPEAPKAPLPMPTASALPPLSGPTLPPPPLATSDRVPPVQLAPAPRRPQPLAAPPPLSPHLANGQLGDLSSVVRRSRVRRTFTGTLAMALAALAVGALVVVALKPGLLGLHGFKGISALLPSPQKGPARAQLRVESTPPGARVFVDEVDSGLDTPAQLSLEPGKPHALRLEKEGFEGLSETLPAFEGQSERAFSLKERMVGALKLETQPPGARIVIDGRQLDRTTPTILSDLDPAREHEVVFSLDGFEDEVLQARVKPGKLSSLSRQLKPRGGAKVASAPGTQPQQQTQQQTPEPAAPPQLSVVTQPAGIPVEIDGKKAGQTPLSALKLAPGRHEVRFVDAERFLDQVAVVQLAAGATERLERSFAPRKVRFNVTPFAKVYIRDREFADSPGDAELVPGTYKVTYSCPEIRARRTEMLTVPAGSDTFKVQLTLREGEGYE